MIEFKGSYFEREVILWESAHRETASAVRLTLAEER
jgi:hypothetical protein